MRYTAVFEFKEGEEPAVGKKDGWLGGELCAVLFSDGLAELQAIKEAAEAVIFQNAHMGDDTWYHLAELLGWNVEDDDTATERPNANNLILDYALEKGVDINDIIPPDQKLTILNEEFLDAVEKRAKLSFQNYHLSRRGQQLSMWDMYETHIIEASLFLAKR